MTVTTAGPASATEDLLPFRDPGFRADPYPYYARLRQEHPVHRHPVGLYVVSRYEDVARLIRNPTLSVQQLDFGPAAPIHHTMLGKDAPDHTRLRRITNRWFTPKAVEEWSKVMRAAVEAVLDEVGEGRRHPGRGRRPLPEVHLRHHLSHLRHRADRDGHHPAQDLRDRAEPRPRRQRRRRPAPPRRRSPGTPSTSAGSWPTNAPIPARA